VLNRVYAYNNRISCDRQVGAVALTLIKVADERLGGTEVVRVPEGVDGIYFYCLGSRLRRKPFDIINL
jgi:hypothetical protein